MMTPDLAKATHSFLGRATIQGNEVGTFIRCLQALEQIIYATEATQGTSFGQVSPQAAQGAIEQEAVAAPLMPPPNRMNGTPPTLRRPAGD